MRRYETSPGGETRIRLHSHPTVYDCEGAALRRSGDN